MKEGIFNQEEIDFLKEFYPLYGPDYCAEKLNRKKKALLNKVRKLKLYFRRCKFKYRKEELEPMVKSSYTLTEVLKKIGSCGKGGSYKLLNKYIKQYSLDISHFNSKIQQINALKNNSKLIKTPLELILTENSTYNTTNLKKRLYNEGLKSRCCELCGQGEEWQGKKMSLILDHINGVSNDHRLENLRIVCPNCNATLDTHCRGHKKIEQRNKKEAERIEQVKESLKQKGIRARRVPRPPYEELIRQVQMFGYSATGRKYGVSDNSIRKWIRSHENGTY